MLMKAHFFAEHTDLIKRKRTEGERWMLGEMLLNGYS